MVRRVKDMDLQLARERGAQVSRPKMEIDFPGLATIIDYFKNELAEEKKDAASDAEHKKKWAEKMAKFDELITAVKAIKAPAPARPMDLKPLIAAVLARREESGDDSEPCDYKLTGKRDQRGLIDLEYGLTFTAIRNDD